MQSTHTFAFCEKKISPKGEQEEAAKIFKNDQTFKKISDIETQI